MKKIFLAFIFMHLYSIGFSQEDTTKATSSSDMGVDIVNLYVWRGIPADLAPNIQGWGKFEIKGFSIGAWGTSSFDGSFLETDIYIGYAYKKLSITLTDYFESYNDYFNFKNNATTHVDELGIEYTISDKFPLKIMGAVIVYGNDKQVDSLATWGKHYYSENNNYSGYVELKYPITLKKTKICLSAGMVTHESDFYDTKGFTLINGGISISKEIKVNDKYNIPLSYSFITNPEYKMMYSVFSISF